VPTTDDAASPAAPGLTAAQPGSVAPAESPAPAANAAPAPDAGPSADFTVEFPTGETTRVVVGPLALLPALAKELLQPGARAGLLCDARLVSLHGPALRALQPAFGDLLARPVSEARKQLAEVEAMCEVLSARGLSRDGFVVAVGGGVLTDLAGLAAALYLRGVPWVSVPSTLLAQVDAGLGGKTGANLRAGKNLVGAFHQPRLVLCDPALLATLPARERWSGLAEVVKCALLDSSMLDACEALLDRAAAGEAAALAPLIEASLRHKARVVASDEREGGARSFLNLGHTVGHALEAATGYQRFTHGEAVALGLRSALELSRPRMSAADHARALRLVQRLRVEPAARLDEGERERALQSLTRDKKVKAGRVRFVLLRAPGAAELVEVAPADCIRALDAALA
jgi:3-dehydroquinate synthetase